MARLTLRPAPERVCLWLLDMSTDPPFHSFCSKRVAIDWAWAKDFDFILYYITTWKRPRNNWRTPLKKPTTPPGNPPTPSPIWPIYIPIDSSWREDSEYVIFIEVWAHFYWSMGMPSKSYANKSLLLKKKVAWYNDRQLERFQPGRWHNSPLTETDMLNQKKKGEEEEKGEKNC